MVGTMNVANILKRIKGNKAAGLDKVVVEFRRCGSDGIEMFEIKGLRNKDKIKKSFTYDLCGS